MTTISAQGNAAQEFTDAVTGINESEPLLQSILNTELIGMGLLEAQRDSSGHIKDFLIRFVNSELAKLTQRTDLVGKLYGEEFPGIRQMGIYELILKTMETGQSQRMEYNYQHDGFNKWFSSMFVKTGNGLVATYLDISDRKKAEEDRLTLLAEQNQKIFSATLTAQEDERKRIAESLHNGLGQILYGVKLSLDQLNLNMQPLDVEALKKIKQDTNELLTRAIKQSRRISHELTPVILEDFGLKEAIKECCKDLGPMLQASYSFKGFRHGLYKSTELAVYRMVQELLMNVVKHAQATAVFINIEVRHKTVILAFKDNGIGFKGDEERTGIGLTLIKNKIKLLNGKFALTYGENEGTSITISISKNNH
ncbi:MAG: sensor signal transduction histidine kinase [Mucilaginibacter sp.]|nr:sensor signal transduction histidine kinase [Mucilaginibacter sp.]